MKGRPPRTDDHKAFDLAMGARLRRFREDCERRHGQAGRAWFADMIGATVEQYQKWEQKGPVPPYWLARICRVFGVHPWFLLTGMTNFDGDVINDASADAVLVQAGLFDDAERHAHNESAMRRTARNQRVRIAKKKARARD